MSAQPKFRITAALLALAVAWPSLALAAAAPASGLKLPGPPPVRFHRATPADPDYVRLVTQTPAGKIPPPPVAQPQSTFGLPQPGATPAPAAPAAPAADPTSTTTTSSTTTAPNPSAGRGYLGKPSDPGFGLLDMKNRWYDPATGRFLSPDPVFWEIGRNTPDSQKALRSSQAQNPTSYAGGNPVRYSDPEGRAYDAVWDLISWDISLIRYSSADTPEAKQEAARDVAMDAAALAAPGVLALGTVRWAKRLAAGYADDAVQAGRKLLNALLRRGDEAVDATKAVKVAAGAAASLNPSQWTKLGEWKNAKTLARHFRDHAGKLGAKTIGEYQKQATDLLQRATAENLPRQVGSDGVIRVYDPVKNVFGSYNSNGSVRTFFKPDDGADYWNAANWPK